MISLPKLYAILDDCSQGERLIEFALQLQAGGCKLMQYRNKSGDAREMLADASELKRVLDASVRLIMNDRADLAVLAQLDGVHLGQDDVSTEGARKVIGPDLWLGVSTHNPEQVEKANATGKQPVVFVHSAKPTLIP